MYREEKKKKKGIVDQAYLTIFMLTKTIQIATLHHNTEHTTQKFELQLDLKHYWELSLVNLQSKIFHKTTLFSWNPRAEYRVFPVNSQLTMAGIY